jgi:tRNA-dihydrouridine synthase B
MQIGPHKLTSPLLLAPMAGVTDRPTRILCRRFGAGLAVSEMVTANNLLFGAEKTLKRIDHSGEPGLRAVQIAGSDPLQMAEAARFNVDRGADIIDINMGCPAKKVCNKLAGSALLSDEPLVERILDAVVKAVDVPVTLKIRTGPDPDNRNAVRIAQIAERSGIQSLAIHGRTRADKYRGDAEFDTIRAVVQSVSLPVVANGDITSPERAAEVLHHTGASAVMIGRGAQGRPWLFREMEHYLRYGSHAPAISTQEVCATAREHLEALYDFHGDYLGPRIARKHIGWYVAGIPGAAAFRQKINKVECARRQCSMVEQFLSAGWGATGVASAA